MRRQQHELKHIPIACMPYVKSGTSEPEPCAWVFGGDMYPFAHLYQTRCIMNGIGKFVVGDKAFFARDEVSCDSGAALTPILSPPSDSSYPPLTTSLLPKQQASFQEVSSGIWH